MTDKFAFKLCGWIAADSREQAFNLLAERFAGQTITIMAVSQLPSPDPDSIVCINDPPLMPEDTNDD